MSDFKSFDDFQKELHHLDPEQTVIRESEEIPESGRQIPQTSKLKKNPGKKKARRRWEPYLMGTAVGFLLLAGAVLFLPVPMGDIRLQGNEAVTRKISFLMGISENRSTYFRSVHPSFRNG